MEIANAKTVDEIIGVVKSQVLTPLTSFLFVLATAVFIWGVIEFLMGKGIVVKEGGSERKITLGKKHMVWGLFGLLIMYSAWAIIKVLENFFK